MIAAGCRAARARGPPRSRAAAASGRRRRRPCRRARAGRSRRRPRARARRASKPTSRASSPISRSSSPARYACSTTTARLVEAALASRASSARSARGVGTREHAAARVRARVDLDHLAVEQLGLSDLEVEDARPRLVADREQVAEAARDRERERRALALEQRVGRERRAHADVAGGNRRVGREPEQLRGSPRAARDPTRAPWRRAAAPSRDPGRCSR